MVRQDVLALVNHSQFVYLKISKNKQKKPKLNNSKNRRTCRRSL